MVEQIATASSEQSDGIHQVHRAIANIDKVTQENAALVEETTAAAESLNMEASHLRENMSFFKTGHA
jgi:methyl-accepting chemotaxis protein